MSPKSQMAKALPRGLELLRKAGKTNNPKAPGCQNPSACAAPHSMSSAWSRAVDFPLSWHLCFSLQALCLLLPEFHSFDCSRQSVLLPTNHPIPECSCSDAHSPTHGSALPAHFQLPRPVSPSFMANTIGEEKKPHFPDPVVQPHSPVGFGSC